MKVSTESMSSSGLVRAWPAEALIAESDEILRLICKFIRVWCWFLVRRRERFRDLEEGRDWGIIILLNDIIVSSLRGSRERSLVLVVGFDVACSFSSLFEKGMMRIESFTKVRFQFESPDEETGRAFKESNMGTILRNGCFFLCVKGDEFFFLLHC